jgi:hypothetical protein
VQRLLRIPKAIEIPEDLEPGDIFFIDNPIEDLGWCYGVQPDGTYLAMDSPREFDPTKGFSEQPTNG